MILVFPLCCAILQRFCPAPALAEMGGKDHVLCLAAAAPRYRSISQKGGEENYFCALLTLLSLILQTGVGRGPLGAGLRDGFRASGLGSTLHAA